jgi:hypothetical protein
MIDASAVAAVHRKDLARNSTISPGFGALARESDEYSAAAGA